MFKKIDKILLKINTVIGILSYVGFIGVMLLITVDVCLRKLGGSGILGTYEMVQYILMAAVFASFAYTQSLKGHIKVTMILHLIPRAPKYILLGITGILGAVAAAIVGYAAIQQALYSIAEGTVSSVLHFPYYPFFWIEALGMFAYAVILLWDSIKSFAAVGKEELAAEIDENLS